MPLPWPTDARSRSAFLADCAEVAGRMTRLPYQGDRLPLGESDIKRLLQAKSDKMESDENRL